MTFLVSWREEADKHWHLVLDLSQQPKMELLDLTEPSYFFMELEEHEGQRQQWT